MFNVVRVVRVEPGAMLDGSVFDQWIYIEFGGSTIPVFDPEMIAPDYASGELHEVRLGLMATRVDYTNSSASGLAGNRYYGKVVLVRERDGIFSYLLDINGLKVHLFDDSRYSLGDYLVVQGRLDLEDIKLPNSVLWYEV